jgi:hypothetical protein
LQRSCHGLDRANTRSEQIGIDDPYGATQVLNNRILEDGGLAGAVGAGNYQ